MSLPAPNLDDRRFDDLVSEAKSLIPRYAPLWNDYNVSDPGITLLELFAWFTDLTLYRLNQVPERNYLKFLELVGIRPHTRRAAQVELTFTLAQPTTPLVIVPKGTQVAAEGTEGQPPVVFETDEALIALGAQLKAIQSFDGFTFSIETIKNNADQQWFYPFGANAREGSALLLGFESPVTFPADQLHLAVRIFAEGLRPEGRHCDLDLSQIPAPSELRWECWDGVRWNALGQARDDTRAFTRSGHIYIDGPGNLVQRLTVGLIPQPLYWIAVRLVRNGYDATPRLASVLTNTVFATQVETVQDEVLGGSDGRPDQTFTLSAFPLVPLREGFELRRSDGLNVSVISVQIEIDEGSGFEPWQEVEDFGASDPDDPHFTVDYLTGTVSFAGIKNGRIPIANPANPARNIVARYYRWGGGLTGNVGPGKATQLSTTVDGVDTVTNLFPATGGSDEETVEDAKIRAPRELKARNRAVTAEDFEFLAEETTGVRIRRAKALPLYHPRYPGINVPGVVSVIVVPESDAPNPYPGESTLRAVCEHLNKHRLLTCEVHVIPPHYRKVKIVADVIVTPQSDLALVRRAIEGRLTEFFHSLVGGELGRGWDFGGPIYFSEVVRQILQIRGVNRIDQNRLTIWLDDEAQPACSDVSLCPGELLFSDRHEIRVSYCGARMTGPHYLLLDDRTGWRIGDVADVEVDSCAGGLRLVLLPGAQIPLTAPDGSLGGLQLPISMALDCDDRIYLLDRATERIFCFDPCNQRFAPLPCLGGRGSAPREFSDAGAIAISCWGDLYVADSGNRRVQVFSLQGLALRSILGPLRITRTNEGFACHDAFPKPSFTDCLVTVEWPQGTWLPLDVLVEPDCRVLVADQANSLIHVFDSRGRWVTAWTGAGDGFGGISKPVRLARDNQGRVYIVQAGQDDVVVLDASGKFVEVITLPAQAAGHFCPAALGFDRNGRLHIASGITAAVNVICLDGGGRRITYTYTAGPATDLVFDAFGNAILASPTPVQVPLQAVYATTGTYYSAPLDSRIYRCEWHKLLLDAEIPLGTRVRIDTLTAESEKTIADVLSLPEERWSTHQSLTRATSEEWDCLLDAPEGRFLWLRLTLEGEGQVTPVIRRITLEFPRNTSRRFLPATFSEDSAGRHFLDQFLSITDTIHNRTRQQLSNLYRYFDPMATPADPAGGTFDFLSWLASWMGLALEQRWPLDKRRKLVAAAHRLYALRGTPEGLRQHILLFAGSEPRILEHFRLRRWFTVDGTRLGAAAELWGSTVVNRLQLSVDGQLDSSQLIDINDPLRDPFHARAHRFTVFVPALSSWGPEEQAILERIVEIAKPAHTCGDVQLLRPRFRVGIQSFIGVDTVVGRYPDHAAADQTKLGYDSVLTGVDAGQPGLNIGQRARIGASTRLT